MKSSSSILLLSILPLALTSPILTTRQTFPIYTVSNYTTGCSPAGCAYSFDIAYVAPPCTTTLCEPSFSTHCSGTDIQGALRPCDDALISSNETPGWSNATLQVRHQWDQDVTTGTGGEDGRFYALANYTVVDGVGVDGPASFEIAVTEEYGVV
jgi:hypothetical protein